MLESTAIKEFRNENISVNTKKIKELVIKYKELITYVVFGGLTTVVNLIVFKLAGMALGDERYLISNTIAWIAAVIFAFITNKLWVFESKSFKKAILVLCPPENSESLRYFCSSSNPNFLIAASYSFSK